MTDSGKCKGRGTTVIPDQKPQYDNVDDPSIIPEKYAKKLRGKLGS